MIKERNPNKSLSNEAKYCGICNKDFKMSEYKLLCRGKCTRSICHKCSGLTLFKIKALAEGNGERTCGKCQGFTESDTRRSVVVHSASDDTLDEEIESEKVERENCTIGDVMKQLRIDHEFMTAELKSLKKDITIMQQSMQFLTEAFEDKQNEKKIIKKKLQEEGRSRHELQCEVEKLEAGLKLWNR
ncbi:hypothetical protein WA026_011201 [Henosepilachna vigintioctopunctata]|uniref:Uncharacterized protein n=1 Tax=Henosepilachna vigintioctopunctata TaxID=420089 RepID=A0AAW1U5Y2_9CUCU